MSDSPTTAVGPYSSVREAGGLFFISGVIGVDLATKTAGPDIESQTVQVFKNLATVLASAGLKLDDIVKTTIFLTDMGDFAAVNEIYAGKFTAPRPARSCVAVAELPRVANTPLKVEIEAIACRKPY